jgi:hypothetical protein
MPKITTVVIVCLRLFIPLGQGKKSAMWKFMVGVKKNSASELKVVKKIFS